jgi:hypothetical protein
MKKFIIMTTAIIRPELHNKSIKLFYDNYYYNFKNYVDERFEIHHIINIDSPEKLKPHFTSGQTVENFNKIIPEKVKKHYIVTEKPGFGMAFKNIMDKIKELGLLDSSNFYFWFEDDWAGIYVFNLFMYVQEAMRFKCCALTNTSNSQCGSFRGGPIMNGEFFIRYFNLVNMGLFNPNKDPERQVVRFIGKYGNFNQRKLYNRDKLIKLVQIHRKNVDVHLDNLGDNLYLNKFNKLIGYEKHFISMDDPNYTRYCELNNRPIEYSANINNYLELPYKDILEKLDTECIVYIILKPYNFEDCGREFANSYNLIKWSDTDNITYS